MRTRFLLAVGVIALAGCSRDLWQRAPGPDDAVALVPWFSNMHRGLAIQPFKMPLPPVEGTVPITGIDPLIRVIPSNYATLDRMENPIPVTAESLDIGKKFYDIYCYPCHGREGAGDGPVNEKLFIAPSLLTERARDLSEGMIYGIIRAGRGAMQSYAEGVRGDDRWHVVNYLRQLQGAAQR